MLIFIEKQNIKVYGVQMTSFQEEQKGAKPFLKTKVTL